MHAGDAWYGLDPFFGEEPPNERKVAMPIKSYSGNNPARRLSKIHLITESVVCSVLFLNVEMHNSSTSAGGRVLRGAHFCPFSCLRVSSALKKNHR